MFGSLVTGNKAEFTAEMKESLCEMRVQKKRTPMS